MTTLAAAQTHNFISDSSEESMKCKGTCVIDSTSSNKKRTKSSSIKKDGISDERHPLKRLSRSLITCFPLIRQVSELTLDPALDDDETEFINYDSEEEDSIADFCLIESDSRKEQEVPCPVPKYGERSYCSASIKNERTTRSSFSSQSGTSSKIVSCISEVFRCSNNNNDPIPKPPTRVQSIVCIEAICESNDNN